MYNHLTVRWKLLYKKGNVLEVWVVTRSMSSHGWNRRLHRVSLVPKCVLCDVHTVATKISCEDHMIIRGWKCLKCGITYLHPDDIRYALEILEEESEY